MTLRDLICKLDELPNELKDQPVCVAYQECDGDEFAMCPESVGVETAEKVLAEYGLDLLDGDFRKVVVISVIPEHRRKW
jgi:hypothetical protein